MVQATSGSTEFNGNGDPGRNPRDEAKEETKANTVADSEDDRVGYRPGKQSQRAVLPAQQIVSEIKAPEHIETAAGDTDGCDRMVVHSVIVEVTLGDYGQAANDPKEFRHGLTRQTPTNQDSRGRRYC